MSKVEITEIIPLQTDRENPILAHFQSGRISKENAAEMECYLAKDTSKEKERILLAVTADNVHAGCIGQGFPTELMRNFIAIRNKKTNKMRLIEVEECSLISRHYDNLTTKTTMHQRSKEDAKRLLFSTFGGKMANRAMESRERMKVNVDIVKDQLDRTVAETKSATTEVDAFDEAKLEREQYLESMIPPMNKLAKKLDNVYKLTDLIDATLLDRLDSEALEVLKTNPSELPISAKYLLNIIQKCQECKDPDSAENLTKIKVCIYIDALLNFLKEIKKPRQNMQIVDFSNITKKVETNIRQKFSQPDTLKITKTNYILHKVTCYVVVLSLLIVEKYEMDVAHIVEAINMSKTKLMDLSSVVPVRMKTGTNLMVLKLPSTMRAKREFARKRRTM